MHDPLLAGPWSIVSPDAGCLVALAPVLVAGLLAWLLHGGASSGDARARPERSAP